MEGTLGGMGKLIGCDFWGIGYGSLTSRRDTF